MEAIKADIQTMITHNPGLGPKFLRLAWTDCIGGCDGCVDLQNPANWGLDSPVYAIEQSILKKYTSDERPGISRADIWALAGLTGAEMASNNNNNKQAFPMDWFGRVDCEDLHSSCKDQHGNEVECSATRGPHRDIPSSNLDNHGLLQWFRGEFGFSPQETVAIMGAHTLGSASAFNSGFHGSWTANPYELDNSYYRNLVVGDTSDGETVSNHHQAPRRHSRWKHSKFFGRPSEKMPGTPVRHQWTKYTEESDDEHLIMMNVDASLVKEMNQHEDGRVDCAYEPKPTKQSKPTCPFARNTLGHMSIYKDDQELWLHDFEKVLQKMVNHGYRSERCAKAPCRLGVNADIMVDLMH